MPSVIWNGAISFGLVTIPIKLVNAAESHRVAFHQIHIEDGGRIRYRKTCEIDDRQLSDAEIGRAYEVSKDQLVEVTDDDLAGMPLPTAKAIDIVAFVSADSIDPIRLGDSYYLEADGQVAAKPYALMRQALERSEKVAVAKYALRGRERLGLLSIKENALVLHAMHWDDEIRDPSSLAPKPVDLTDDEIDAAVVLMSTMERDDVSGFKDGYQEALDELLAAKSEGRAPAGAGTGEAPEGGKVVDLMAALTQSVEAARRSRGEATEAGEPATVHDLPAASAKKKTAAKKTGTAKKTAATTASSKKTTAKKQPPKKTTRSRGKSA